MNTILAMDTSGPSLSVALTRGDQVVYECARQNGLTHSEGLMALVDQALTAGGIGASEVDCFAVVHGPGSFTGVRIGVATAKSMAQAAEKPCVGINALEALAAGAALFEHTVCPMQDARDGQVYAAAFQSGCRMLPDEAVRLDALLARLASLGRCCFVGDGAVKYRDAIAEGMGELAVFPPEAMYLRASCVARLAMKRIPGAGSWRELTPYYLRLPQAERERIAKEAAHG